MADTSWLDWAAGADNAVEGGGWLRGKVNGGGVRSDALTEARKRDGDDAVGVAS
jgi:hypothetical protein